MAHEDQQELLEEGWQAHDLRSGVAKVFAEAKKRRVLAVRVVAVWAVLIFIYGTLDMAGVTAVAPPWWDIGCGFAAILLSALAISSSQAMFGAAVAIFADLAIIAYRFPQLLDSGSSTDHVFTGLRVAIAPVAMFLVLNGYFGALTIEAFKEGFSSGGDWRTRVNPRMMQFIVITSCLGALVLGVVTWLGAIATGFASTNVVWITRWFFEKPIHMTVSKKVDVEEAKTDGKKPGVFADFTFLDGKERGKAVPDGPVKYPDSAMPIVSLEGLDEFMTREVEDAYDFGSETDEAGCLLEGQGRQDRCRDERCRYWSRVFTRACFVKSKKSEKFCDGVPEPTMAAAGETWAQRMCAGRLYETCREILFAMQGHCHPPKAADLARPGEAGGAGEAAKPDVARNAVNPE